MNEPTAALYDALARTVLLVKLDIFPRLDEAQITDGLAALTVRIVADAKNLSTAPAQTMVVASAISLAQSGAGVVLDVPNVEILGPQPPLPAGEVGLSSALRAHLDELPSSAIQRPPAEADLVVIVGDTAGAPSLGLGHCLRVTGNSWSTRVVANSDPLPQWNGDQPFGAMLGACAISAEAFRIAMRKLAEHHDVTPSTGVRLDSAERIELAVAPTIGGSKIASSVDVVSAGAITNSAIFTLSRVPALKIDARVFDDDRVQISNLNRYPLLAMRSLGAVKVDALAERAPDGWSIEAGPVRLGLSTIDDVLPLAQAVLIGVDDIPSRWLVQRAAPEWVCVAGTSHFEVVVSEHESGGPCAGCMHPRDDPTDAAIPTVTFVSMLAGVLQAHRLAARLAGDPARPPTIGWALGLEGEHGLFSLGQSPRVDCPVGCAASRALSAP